MLVLWFRRSFGELLVECFGVAKEKRDGKWACFVVVLVRSLLAYWRWRQGKKNNAVLLAISSDYLAAKERKVWWLQIGGLRLPIVGDLSKLIHKILTQIYYFSFKIKLGPGPDLIK